MYPVSTDFLETIATHHRVYTLCQVYPDGVLSGNNPVELKILDGNVTIDDVAIRRRADLTLVDDTGELTPNDANDLLSPFGTEIRLWRGVYLPSGEVEAVPLITGGLSDVQIDDSGQNIHIRLDLYDRSRKVARAKLATDYHVPVNSTYDVAVATLLQQQFPTIELNLPEIDPTFLTPRLIYQTGEDPWLRATELANSVGYDLFFDPLGVLSMRRLTLGYIIDDYYEEKGGRGNPKLLYVNKRIQDESTYNHVVVTGESSTNTRPYRGEAADENPFSPTYWRGPMGDVVYTFLGNSAITSDLQAELYADFLLSKKVGAVETIQITGLVNPALDINDHIQVTRTPTKIDNVYQVDKLTIPMTFARGISISSRQTALLAA